MSTERPETIELGSNIIAGTDPKRIVSAVEKMVESPTGWRHPYGENVSAKMVGVMKRYKPKHFLQEMRDEISDERIRIHFAGSVTEGWNN